MSRNGAGLALALALLSWGARVARADSFPDSLPAAPSVAPTAPAAASEVPAAAPVAPADAAPRPRPDAEGVRVNGLEALVPEAAVDPYRLAEGERPYRNRLSVSPAVGSLGSERLFALRVAYNPDSWLAYEGSLAHNPGVSVHAVLHTLTAIVRHPRPGRFQPYLSLGYGMIIVFPGLSVNAAPVTKNAITAGGGLEFYIRGDLAIRADLAHATVFGRQRDRDGVVAYNYLQQTIGLAFYRSIGP